MSSAYRGATHFSNDLEESPRCDYDRIFSDAGQVSQDSLDQAHDHRRELLDTGSKRLTLSATELATCFRYDTFGALVRWRV